MLFNFRRRKQCPHELEVKENFIIVRVVRCIHDVDHPGMHQNGTHNWMSSDRLHRYMEEYGETL